MQQSIQHTMTATGETGVGGRGTSRGGSALGHKEATSRRVGMTTCRHAAERCGWGDPHRLVAMRQGSVAQCSDKAGTVVSHQLHQ